MILKFQQGNVLPLNEFKKHVSQRTSDSKESRSSEKQDDLDKFEFLKLLADSNILPSDSSQLYEDFNKVLKLSEEMPYNTSAIESAYLKTLYKLNNAEFSYKMYESTKDLLTERDSLNEVALDTNGYFYCVDKNSGNYVKVSPDLLKNSLTKEKNLIPLTNNDLLLYRIYNPESAFNSNILSTIQNGLSMKYVYNLIQHAIDSLGSNSSTREGYHNSSQIINGLEMYTQAIEQEGSVLSLDYLYKHKIIDKNQHLQINQSLAYILSILPNQVRSFLEYKSGFTEDGIKNLLGSLIYSKTGTTDEFSLNLVDDNFNEINSKSNNKSTTETDDKTIFDLNPVSMLEAGYGQKNVFNIQTPNGIDNALLIYTVSMPIFKRTGDSVGVNIPLSEISKSGYAGYLDFKNIFMGNTKIESINSNSVLVDGSALHVAYLPIDLIAYQEEGDLKPDLNLLERYKKALSELRENKITEPKQINEIYLKHKLPIMYSPEGDILITYQKFAMLDGHALGSAFKENQVLDTWIKEIFDMNTLDNIETNFNMYRSDNDRLKLDKVSKYDLRAPIFTGHDPVYEGVIFIHVNKDYFTATSGFGNYPNTEEAKLIEANQQANERVHNKFIDAGNTL